jgi:phosphate transport system substrate-binding protein
MSAWPAAQAVRINGAGATFPNPIYQKWFSEYKKLHANVEINYQSQGSGAGIQQLTNRRCSWRHRRPDDPGAIEERASLFTPADGHRAVVPIQSSDRRPAEFQRPSRHLPRQITKWNDPVIATLSGRHAAATDVTVAHRADGPHTFGSTSAGFA